VLFICFILFCIRVCVERLFPKVTLPLRGQFGVRQKDSLPGPPPVVPDPESLAAQAAYRGRQSASHGQGD
jgi:hypothetical protein